MNNKDIEILDLKNEEKNEMEELDMKEEIIVEENIMEENNKKGKVKLLAVLGISALTAIGGTLAYFTTSNELTNQFDTAEYGVNVVETFTSPDKWTPGTTTPKTITVTNTGNVPIAVRTSYTERWVNANGEEISLKDANNNVAAVINFNTGWTKDEDGYYYYGSKDSLTQVAPEGTTTSFITGVTFNSSITASLNKTTSSDGKTVTFTSTGTGYDNATYYLTVTTETIQYDQASNVWE